MNDNGAVCDRQERQVIGSRHEALVLSGLLVAIEPRVAHVGPCAEFTWTLSRASGGSGARI